MGLARLTPWQSVPKIQSNWSQNPNGLTLPKLALVLKWAAHLKQGLRARTYLVQPAHGPGWRPLNPSGFRQLSVSQMAYDDQTQGSKQLTSFLASCSALLWLAMDIHWKSHQKSPDILVSWQVFTSSKPKSNTAKQQAVDEVSELNSCERCYSLYIQRFLFIFYPSPGHAFRDCRLAWLLWWSRKTNLLSPKVSNESTTQPLANAPNES